jgi:hypothetical protein
MVIGGVEVYPGRPCPHSTGSGCDDYEHRPTDPCVSFNCGWILPGSPLPDWMKPSNAKVIVLFGKLTWRGAPVDLAAPVGRRVPPRALEWLQRFSRGHGRPLLYTEQIEENGRFQRQQTLLGYGPPDFRQEVAGWRESGLRLW